MTMLRRIAGPGLLAVLLVVTGACGGGGDDGAVDVATLGGEQDDTGTDGGGGAGDGDEELTEAEREDAMLEFAECMREHGIDMPDPTEQGGIALEITPETEDEMEAAQEACDPILEDAMGERPQLSPEEEAEMQDRMLAFAECMREQGIDMPDPEVSADGGRIRVEARDGSGATGAAPGSGPGDDEFDAAQEACQEELGFEGGPGGVPVFGGHGGGPSTNQSSTADEDDA